MDRTVFGEQNPKVAELFCNKPSPNGILVCGRYAGHSRYPKDDWEIEFNDSEDWGENSPCGEWM